MSLPPNSHEADRQLLELADKLDHDAAMLEGQTKPPSDATRRQR